MTLGMGQCGLIRIATATLVLFVAGICCMAPNAALSARAGGGQRLEVDRAASLVWHAMPSMSVARYDFGLKQGFDTLYAIGGFDAHGTALSSVESYDLDYNRWSAAAPMPTARGDFGIDVHGISTGIDVFGGANSRGKPLNVVEKYNPDSNTWYHLTTMPQARSGLAVAHDGVAGNMVVAGGVGPGGKVRGGVWEFIAARHTWRTIAPMHTPRYDFALVLGPGSQPYSEYVYAIGGFGADHKPLRSVEAYDRNTNTWTQKAPMPLARGGLTATPDWPAGSESTLTALGGFDANGHARKSVQRYNATKNTWTTLPPMPAARGGLTAIWPAYASQSGLFVIGGKGGTGTPLASADVWQTPPAKGWDTDTPMPVPQDWTSAVLATDGTIYAVDAFGLNPGKQVVEAFDPSTHSWNVRAPLPFDASGVTIVAGPDGKIYAMGGTDYGTATGMRAVEVYDPATNTWTARAPMPAGRGNAAAVTGKDGKIYIMGGAKPDPSESDNTLYVRGLDVYDPRTNTWQVKAAMPAPRQSFGAAVGPDGTIYAIGGTHTHYKGVTCLTRVEAYNPRMNVWSERAPLHHAICNVGATTGPDGKIYVVSGDNSNAAGTAESYNPKANAWSVLPSMTYPRRNPGVVAALNGTIYVIGGQDGDPDPTATVQTFDPSKAK